MSRWAPDKLPSVFENRQRLPAPRLGQPLPIKPSISVYLLLDLPVGNPLEPLLLRAMPPPDSRQRLALIELNP